MQSRRNEDGSVRRETYALQEECPGLHLPYNRLRSKCTKAFIHNALSSEIKSTQFHACLIYLCIIVQVKVGVEWFLTNAN